MLQHATLVVSGFVLVCLVSFALFGPIVWTVDPNAVDFSNKFGPISRDHPAGTDDYGRDLLARLAHGARMSYLGGLVILAGAASIGLIVGAVAAFATGRLEAALAGLIDALIAMPSFILAIALVGMLGRTFENLVLALTITSWPWYARVFRGFILTERSRDYLLAARSLGSGNARLFTRHLLPNLSGPTVTLLASNTGSALLSLTAFSFLGLGAQPPEAEWGAMMSAARIYAQTEPRLIVTIGLFIALTVMSVNLLGDWLRDRLDPDSVG